MSIGRIAAAGTGLLLVAVYAGGSWYWVRTDGSWWSTLARPAWQPPDWVFGVLWPFHFTILSLAMVAIARTLTTVEVVAALVVFAASIAAALLWSYLFYGPHQLAASTVALAVAVVLTIPLLTLTFRASTTLGWLLVPYQLWLCVATSLAWGYAALNRA